MVIFHVAEDLLIHLSKDGQVYCVAVSILGKYVKNVS